MDSSQFLRDIGNRFHRPTVPTLFACADLADPIVFSHVRSDGPMPAPTLTPPIENAFSIHVHHMPVTKGDLWIQGRHSDLPRVRDGGVFIFDLRTEPVAHLHQRYEFSRFQLSRSTMDELAYERGLRRLSDLRVDTCTQDAVVKSLAMAMIQRSLRFGDEPNTLFNDSVALAFFAHIAKTYGGAIAPVRRIGVLAPWQVRALEDWIEGHLGDAISIGRLAALVRLSPSHFARAFAKTFGMPPHRWLLRRRVERAKALLANADATLSDVAAVCGFADQSHFTHVFASIVGTTPGSWRRRQRR